jgi:hypothetical protein
VESLAGYAWIAVTVAAVIIVIGLIALRDKIGRRINKAMGYVPPVPPVEIARIEESADYSVLGALCVFGLLIFQVFAVLAMVDATSYMQKAAIGTMWIAANVFFGIGILAGRRRNYRVFRDQQPQQPARQPET